MEPQAIPAPPTPPIPTPTMPDSYDQSAPTSPTVNTPVPSTPEPIQPPDSKMSQKLLIPSIILLIVAVILVTFKLILKNKVVPPPQPTPTASTQPTPSPTPTATADPAANWKTYENNYWKISFKYPDTMFKPCPNYTIEKEGIRFWGPQFGCPDGHDILYKIGFVGYDLGKYIEPKKPSLTETITINGKEAQKKTYVYDELDGPLSSLKQSVEVVFNLSNGTVILQQLGDNIDEQKAFDQILSTFRFTE